MNINDPEFYKFRQYVGVWQCLDGYNHIGVNHKVCGGEPTIIGTRIKPENIYNYGTVKEIMEDFDLTEDEVREAILYVESKQNSYLIRKGEYKNE
jgi:uncharacterized protein (DUF433 family)